MRIFGVKKVPSVYGDISHPNHWAFAHKVGITAKDVLASTFQMANIGSHPIHASDQTLDSLKANKIENLMGPTVYYLSVDHENEVVVLTLRGTMGLSDALTDFTCEYVTFENFQFHKGMFESAKKVSTAILSEVKQAMEYFEGYNLVLTGHSLGGGIAAILSILWSDVLNSKVASHFTFDQLPHRKIKCFTFGVPCIGDRELANKCRNLITSVVHGSDMVPTLSLGLVQDLKHMMTYLTENEEVNTCEKIISNALGLDISESITDEWTWKTYLGMKKRMNATKLYPPGKVIWIRCRSINKRVPKSIQAIVVEEPDNVVQNEAKSGIVSNLASNAMAPVSYISGAASHATKAATSTLSSFTNWAAQSFYPSAATTSRLYSNDSIGSSFFHETEQVLISMDIVEDVDEVFGGLNFAKTMLSDHLPSAYEAAISHLVKDILQKE
eukprot:NODE_178_length_14069_cov_0.746815.p3 type:complete len:441 gc:universal NODE_178_length_14069_cov_0.746815:3670-2348(-)